MISNSNASILIIGAGPVHNAILSDLATVSQSIVAADGGANQALAAGLLPDVVIGDGDSLDAAARAAIPPERLLLLDGQDTTDLEKCLERVAAPLLIGLGFLDGRLDHVLAAMTALATWRDKRILLIGGEDACFHITHDLTISLKKGTRVSIYPLCRTTARSEGLDWPLDGLDLTPLGQIATSNRASGPVTIRPDGPGLIGMVPAVHWRQAAQALWPAFPGG